MKNFKIYENALIVVDMVKGFAKEGGSLYDPAIKNIIPGQVKLVRESLETGKLIIFVKDTHTNDSVEHQRFGDIRHCVKGSGEEELVSELQIFEDLDNVISIEKNSTSFMEAPMFRKILEQAINLKTVEVVGCCTDICILNGVIPMMNYFDEVNKNLEVRLYSDLIETFNSPYHNRDEYSDAAYLLMKQQGAKVLKKF